MTIKDQLLEQLSRTTDYPVLFVGSGMSRRYLGLEDWEGLLRKYAEKTPSSFDDYMTAADGDYPRLASKLAAEFRAVWFKSEEFKPSVERYKSRVKSEDAPLKVEIAKYMDALSTTATADEYTEELAVLKTVRPDCIITTNWDRFLESIFPDFQTYIGQDHLLFSQPQSIAEIYKIHGCCSKPETIVVTEKDYHGFKERNAYLAAKLLTLFVEHPIVFLGYSITDKHVFEILDSIVKCMTSARLSELTHRLFFVEYDRDDQGDLIDTYIRDGLPLTRIRTKNYLPIYEALAAKERTIPAKTLRKLKEQIYLLVKTNDPKVEQVVHSVDELLSGKGPKDYLGFGPDGRFGHKGYTGLTVIDIVRDVVLDDGGHDPAIILEETLPKLLLNNKWVPVFKYLSQSKRVADDGSVRVAGLSKKVVDRIAYIKQGDYQSSGASKKQKSRVRTMTGGVRAVRKDYAQNDAWVYLISLLPIEQVEVEDLGRLLREEFERLTSGGGSPSAFKRLVGYYDLLRFGPPSGMVAE